MPKTFKQTLKDIVDELTPTPANPDPISKTATDLSDLIKAARDAVVAAHPGEPSWLNTDPLAADATELLKCFKPSRDELDEMGLPKDFLDQACSNNTPNMALYMADFTRFMRKAPK